MVISSTGSPDPILTATLLEPILLQRRHRPLFMVDLAVPRDIHKDVRQFDDVYLYTVDDLQDVVDENMASRKIAANAAEKLIHLKVNEYMNWLQSEKARLAIQDFRHRVGGIKNKELERALKKLKQGKAPEWVLEELAHRLSNQFMHAPSARLRQAGNQNDQEIIELINQLYLS